MDETKAKALASQLRKPEGEDGIKIGKWMNDGNASMNRDAINAVAPGENDNILEIGMGNGFFIQEILAVHPSIKYTGVDYSSIMIEEAGKINEKAVESGRVNLVLSTIESMPFGDNSFTKIFTVNTIYFWENKEKAIGELHRVLKHGGQLLIAIRPRYLTKDYPFTKFGFNLFEKEDVKELLAAGGFSSIRFFENNEPDFEKDGQIMKMKNIVISGTKN